MLVDLTYWKRFKREFWKRLWEDLEIGYLDEDLLPILVRLNTDQNIYTLSSCSGRIVISDSTYPWSREETSIVFKKHIPINTEEILEVIKKPVVRRLWLNINGPILHVSVSNPVLARLLLRIARNAGLKHSGILSINKYKGIILELMSGVKATILLKTRERIIVDVDSIEELVSIANEILSVGKRILIRLENTIKKELPQAPDREILDDLSRKGIDINKLSVRDCLLEAGFSL
ncbi:MAG: hypothetical protein ABWW65_07935 [Thermoprotei archaeon]